MAFSRCWPRSETGGLEPSSEVGWRGTAADVTCPHVVTRRHHPPTLACWLVGLVALTSSIPAWAEAPTPAKLPILLVHGIAAAMRPLQRALEATGYRCYTPTLRPADGHLGLAGLARKLRVATDQHFGPRQPVLVVAFSLGGLVARDYLELLGGAKRCRGLVTVSTPHAGTVDAYLIGGQGARDLRPFSPFLRTLWNTEPTLDPVPLVSVWNPLDLVIFPSTNSLWPSARIRLTLCSSHPVMIRSRVTIRVVLREAARLENESAAVHEGQPRSRNH